MEHTNELLTIQQAADLIGVHYNTMYRWIITGQIKAFKPGGFKKKRHWRIRREELDAVMQGTLVVAESVETEASNDVSRH